MREIGGGALARGRAEARNKRCLSHNGKLLIRFKSGRYSTVATVADPETSERGPRNMKYKLPCPAAIFFGPIITGRGVMAPLPPPLDPLLGQISNL